jgi:hypothetical protein
MIKTINARVDSEGVLNLKVPLGDGDANKPVRVTVETVEEADIAIAADEDASWHEFIERIAGSITDPTFVRPLQGRPQKRDPLP